MQAFSYLQNKRKEWNLPNPGSFENLHRDTKNVLPMNFMFDGGKADLAKTLSPSFQVTHSFQSGSSAHPPTYTFGSAYAVDNLMIHGNIDNDGNLQSRINYTINKSLSTKFQGQFGSQPGTSMAQYEVDYNGMDFTANAKAINPMPDGTGVYVASYLQSLSQSIALGIETVLQKPAPGQLETGLSFVTKIHPSSSSILTLTLQQFSAVQASYHRKLSDKVELAADCQVLWAGRREGLASVGAKYEFKQASIRAQVDTLGKVSALLEQRIAPTFAFLISAELDHLKGNSKFGIGIMLEA